jgi:hypothetical protein
MLTKAFGSSEAKRAYDQLVQNRAAITDMSTAFLNSGQTAKDFQAYQSSAAGKVSSAWNRVQLALASAFSPELINSLAGALEELPHIASAAVTMFKDMAAFIGETVDALLRAKDAVFGSTVDAARGYLEAKVAKESGGATALPSTSRQLPARSQKIETSVKIGSNVVATANAEAPANRTRPGGI